MKTMHAPEQGLVQKIAGWIDLHGRREGWLAWVLMRLTGIGLVVYLGLHFSMLAQLAMGPAAYDAFVAFAHSPLIIIMDGVLIFGMVYHGLNGVRVILLGLGAGTRYQALMFWGAFLLSFLMTGVAMGLILAKG